MKMFAVLSSLMFCFSSFTTASAAIGCLPGDCCNNHPCGTTPVPAPAPNCPGGRPLSALPVSFESSKRAVTNCNECGADEVCAEYSNGLGEILGHECKTFTK